MIVDYFLNLLSGILSPIVDALPQGSLPAGVFDASDEFTTLVQSLNGYIPVIGIASFWSHLLLITFPLFVSYRVGLWIYNRIRG